MSCFGLPSRRHGCIGVKPAEVTKLVMMLGHRTHEKCLGAGFVQPREKTLKPVNRMNGCPQLSNKEGIRRVELEAS